MRSGHEDRIACHNHGPNALCVQAAVCAEDLVGRPRPASAAGEAARCGDAENLGGCLCGVVGVLVQVEQPIIDAAMLFGMAFFDTG